MCVYVCVNVVFISVHQYAHLRVCECTNVAASLNAIHIVFPVKEDAFSPPRLALAVRFGVCKWRTVDGISTCIHVRMAGARDGPSQGKDDDNNRGESRKGEVDGESLTLCWTKCFKSKVYQSVSTYVVNSSLEEKKGWGQKKKKQQQKKKTAQREAWICAVTSFPNCLASPGDHR